VTQGLWGVRRARGPVAGLAGLVALSCVITKPEPLSPTEVEARDDTDAKVSLAVAHAQRGDLALTHDDLSLARLEYSQAQDALPALPRERASGKRVCARALFVAQLKREMSVSYNQLGAALQVRGDLPGARDAFQKGLALMLALVEADPTDLQLKQDLSISYERLGGAAQEGGDLEAARAAFEKGLEVTLALVAADPTNVELKRDLSASYSQLGEVSQDQGDLKSAREAFRKGLELMRALVEENPADAELTRDLSSSYNQLGTVLQAERDLKGAREAFRKGLELIEALVEEDPTNPQLAQELSILRLANQRWGTPSL
jgi:tetratricopeptide (TPR) repeat protein